MVIGDNMKITNRNVYDLFPTTALVIGSASGSLAEAIACGVSVLVVGREDELLTNPLVDMGKGKMWDIAVNTFEVQTKAQKTISE